VARAMDGAMTKLTASQPAPAAPPRRRRAGSRNVTSGVIRATARSLVICGYPREDTVFVNNASARLGL
jgi:hypothetical protein